MAAPGYGGPEPNQIRTSDPAKLRRHIYSSVVDATHLACIAICRLFAQGNTVW